MSKRTRLETMAEKFALLLLSEATGGKLGVPCDPSIPPSKIDFKDRRGLLDTITKLLKEKNSKEKDDESSGSTFKEMLNGIESGGEGGGGRNSASSKAKNDPSERDDGDLDDLIEDA